MFTFFFISIKNYLKHFIKEFINKSFLLYRFFKLKLYSKKILFKKYLILFSGWLATASFLLVFIKIVYFYMLFTPISSKISLFILSLLIVIEIKYKINFYLRYFIYRILKVSLGIFFFGVIEETWKDLKRDMLNKQIFCEFFQNENYEIIFFPKQSLFNTFCIEVAIKLIQLRLLIFTEPYLFIILKSILFYGLIFNNLILVTYVLSFLLLLSRFLLLFQLKTMREFFQEINEVEYEKIKENQAIKPNKKNAFIILHIITKEIRYSIQHHYKSENLDFYRLEDDPENNFTKQFALKTLSKFYKINIDEVVNKLNNYYEPIFSTDYFDKRLLSTMPKNKFIIRFLLIIFLSIDIINYIN